MLRRTLNGPTKRNTQLLGCQLFTVLLVLAHHPIVYAHDPFNGRSARVFGRTSSEPMSGGGRLLQAHSRSISSPQIQECHRSANGSYPCPLPTHASSASVQIFSDKAQAPLCKPGPATRGSTVTSLDAQAASSVLIFACDWAKVSHFACLLLPVVPLPARSSSFTPAD